MNPVLNGLLRLSGFAPLIGPIPLTEKKFSEVFPSDPSFIDYFPVINYDKDTETFLLDDLINVGMALELTPKDLDAKPEDTLAEFNAQIASALNDLPTPEEHPYVFQVFLQNTEIENLGDLMERALPERIKNDKLSLAIVDAMREHSDVLTHERGAFPDTRIGDEHGWRASSRRIFLVCYRRCPESYWQKNRKTPQKQLIDDTKSFIMTLNSFGVKSKVVDDYTLIKWLGPFFSGQKFDSKGYTRTHHNEIKALANYDVGQEIFKVAPTYHKSDDPYEQGIYQFGERYIRYLTTEGLQAVPKDGALTIGKAEGESVNASVWERFKAGSMMVWTFVPEPKVVMDAKLLEMETKASETSSLEADFAQEQAHSAREEVLKYKQRILYAQIGCFVSGNSIDEIVERTAECSDAINLSGCLNFIKPQYDLISKDTFVTAIPFVYDYHHDRKHQLRARMTYTSHLAATLPLYGVSRGSTNPCYIMYKRSGEPFMYNPYLKSDRVRVAHSMIFGPTGSGKSATSVNKTTMSMAMNGPRQFIIDKGKSFALLADFYEMHNKKVVRYEFTPSSKQVFPPFYETDKALEQLAQAEHVESLLEDDIDLTDESDDGDMADEKRDYLAEMMRTLHIMVTGGEAITLKPMEKNFVQKSLIKGLKDAKANGAKHAIITDIQKAMRHYSDVEERESLAIKFREMADALELWTTGPRARLFNQIGEGFDPDADLTLIETGFLTDEGNEDMFAVAMSATLTNITSLGEATQYDERWVEVYIDEAHYWMKRYLLLLALIQGTKVWRKLGIWLTLITQDFDDLIDEAKKILAQSENWLMLSMEDEQADQVAKFKKLTDEESYLIRQARIEKPYYAEGVLLSKKFGCGLNRFIHPPLILALGQTDDDEKAARKQLMDEHNCSEVEAMLMIADKIDKQRRAWQEQSNNEKITT